MAKTVFIRIHNDNSVDWAVSGDEGGLPTQTGNMLSQVSDICQGKKVVVFIPGDMVHLGTYMIPARSRQKILLAAPFAMEDDLIGEVDDFHFAIPARTPANNVPVCAITHDRMESILSLLEEQGIKPQVLLTETLSLPVQQDAWTVLLEDDKSTIRKDVFDGFTVDSANFQDYIEIAFQDAGDEVPAKLSIMDFRSLDQGEPLEALIPDTLKKSLELQEDTSASSIIEILIANYSENDVINLLQGNYAVKRIRNQNLSRWYPAAALLIVYLSIKSIGGIMEYVQLSNESELLDQQISQVFRQSLPDVKRIVNPKAQMQQRLKTLKSSGQSGQNRFFTYFPHAIKALSIDNSVLIRGISYRDNHLDIEFNISDLQALEKLKSAIIQTGSKVDIRSAAVQGKVVSARIRIQGEGS